MYDAKEALNEARGILDSVPNPAPAPTPPDVTPVDPAQPEQPTPEEVREPAVNKDWRELDVVDWIGQKIGTSYSVNTLKEDLYKDFGEQGLKGEHIDMITEISERHAQATIEASKGEVPLSAFGAMVRANAAFLAKDTLDRNEQARLSTVQREQDFKDIAREEFGARHYVALQEEAERNYAKELGLPVEEVRNLSPERYRNVLSAYHDRKYGQGSKSLTADAPSRKEQAINDFASFMSMPSNF